MKDIATRKDDGFKILGDMTPEERTAFTFMTTNTGSVVPTVTLNRIIELVESMAPMYDDATPSNMTQGFAVPRHKRILAGDAAATDEGVANEDENDEFDLLAIDGTEIKKHVEISRKMKWESIDAFEDWLVEHLSQRIAVAKETTIIAALNDSTVGIASTNILPAVTADNDGVLEVLSLIKGTGTKVWYANQKTIFSRIAKITDENGRPLFIPSTDSVNSIDFALTSMAITFFHVLKNSTRRSSAFT